MFSIALRVLKDREEAEDILQESFSAAFSNMQNFREDATFGTWLKRIVINKSINQLKKRKIEFDEIKYEIDVADEEQLPYPTLSVSEIQKGMEQLSDGYRIVLSLFLFEGYSHKEIANELNISESTSKTQYLRAKNRLKQVLTEQNQLQ